MVVSVDLISIIVEDLKFSLMICFFSNILFIYEFVSSLVAWIVHGLSFLQLGISHDKKQVIGTCSLMTYFVSLKRDI